MRGMVCLVSICLGTGRGPSRLPAHCASPSCWELFLRFPSASRSIRQKILTALFGFAKNNFKSVGKQQIKKPNMFKINNRINGWLGEKATAWGLSQDLDPRQYKRIDDVIIPNGRGGTSQIDHVVLSAYGIFVVETKNRNGVIEGSEHQLLWRQIVNGVAFDFQNPLLQNRGHICALARLLGLSFYDFHSIIFFCGDARFTWKMPDNVRTSGITTLIRSKRALHLTAGQVDDALSFLIKCKNNRQLSIDHHRGYVRSLYPR